MEEFVADLPVREQESVRSRDMFRTTNSIPPAVYRSLALAARNRAKQQVTPGERQICLIIATELDRLRKTSRKKDLSIWRRCGARRSDNGNAPSTS